MCCLDKENLGLTIYISVLIYGLICSGVIYQGLYLPYDIGTKLTLYICSYNENIICSLFHFIKVLILIGSYIIYVILLCIPIILWICIGFNFKKFWSNQKKETKKKFNSLIESKMLKQANKLFEQNDYITAAIVTRCVLEKILKNICIYHKCEVYKKYQKLGDIIQILKDNNIVSDIEHQQLKLLTLIGNKAVHETNVDKVDVERMINDVELWIEKWIKKRYPNKYEIYKSTGILTNDT